MKFRTATRALMVIASIPAAINLSTAYAQTAGNPVPDAAQQQIRKLIATTYDRPGRKVEITPIVVAGDYAIADWIQGEMGGRALLRHTKGHWEVMACGGDGLKEIGWLKDAGIPPATAKNLLTQLATAERSVSVERVRRFCLFGAQSDPRPASPVGRLPGQ